MCDMEYDEESEHEERKKTETKKMQKNLYDCLIIIDITKRYFYETKNILI